MSVVWRRRPAGARAVHGVRELTATPDAASYVRLPDGRINVVIRHANGGRDGDVCVAGPRTKALRKHTPTGRATIIDVEVGWAVPVFGVSASALTDRIVPLSEVWGARGATLASTVLALRDSDRAVSAIASAMMERAAAAPVSSAVQIARRACVLLEAPGARIEHVARELGVTERHLRRAFRDGTGVSPKQFARAARLHRAVRIAKTEADWSRVAAAAGYSDQAHLVTEFRRLTGLTPAKFRAATR